MILFHSDLDNTLIYSYKREVGKAKRCVELYNGREVSFMTEKTFQLLKKAADKVMLVPTTTRTVEQYERISLGIGVPRYALTCNGGILLINGQRDQEWYRQSVQLVEACFEELCRAVDILEKDKNRNFEVRFIEGLFVFTKSEKPEMTMQRLKERIDLEKIDILQNGVKIYAVPKTLSKGNAVKRLQKMICPEYIIAAGDSEFDLSMLACADLAVVPGKLAQKYFIRKDKVVIENECIYSEGMLEYIWSFLEHREM